MITKWDPFPKTRPVKPFAIEFFGPSGLKQVVSLHAPTGIDAHRRFVKEVGDFSIITIQDQRRAEATRKRLKAQA